MRYFENNKGYSLIEVLVAIGITSIIVAAGGHMLADVFIQSKKAQLATDVLDDLSVASKFLDKDFAGAGVNLNTALILDINQRDFFSYMPYAPSAGVNLNDVRKIILSLDTTKYKGAVNEFVFLVSDKSWPIPLMFSPRKGYLSGGACKEANSLTYNGNCLFDQNIKPEAAIEFGADVLTATKDTFYFFQLPEYFSPTASPKKLISYSFLAPPNADTLGSVAVNNIGISSTTSTSTSAMQSNRYTTIVSTHPNGTLPATLDQYLKKIPFYAGEGTSFNVSKVRLIKYLVEARKVAGRDSAGLYRIELERITDTSFKAKSSTLIAEGFDALTLTRKYISDPIINITFDRQFKLSGKSQGEF